MTAWFRAAMLAAGPQIGVRKISDLGCGISAVSGRARTRSGDPRVYKPRVHAPILASRMFGVPVAIGGASERLEDLGVVKADDSWRIVAVRTNRREATLTGWSLEGCSASVGGDSVEVIWLREALFDRQIVDLDGRRVIRVGDVVLRGDGDLLEVAAVEVGAAAVLRRLGFTKLAARLEQQLLPIDRLHVPSAAAGALLLDAPRERLEQLEPETVTSLLSRLPVSVAENAVRRSRHREAVSRQTRIRRRRHRFPRTSR